MTRAGGRLSSTTLSDFSSTANVSEDFVKLADAYGLSGVCVRQISEVGPAFDAAQRTRGPFLIDFRVDPAANVYPIVPLGKGLNDFWEAPYDQ